MADLSVPGHPAVRVVHAANPAAEAKRLAAELGADVAADAGAAERAVRARVDAGRRTLGGDAAQDGDVLGRAEEIRAAAAVPPPISDDDVAELRHVAADVGRAARIRQRTESRVAEVLQARVAASTGVALHPAAVVAASEAVVAAENAVAAAGHALLEHGAAPAAAGTAQPAPVDDPVLSRPLDDFDEAALVRRRSVTTAVALCAIILGAGLVAYALGAPVAVLGVAVVAAVAAVALLLRRGRTAAAEVDHPAEALLTMAQTVEATDSGRLAASLAAREAWATERVNLEMARDEAEELARVARNRWHQLTGPGTDPRAPDDVIRAHDPQLAYDPRISTSSPTVRTVAAFQRRVQARWRVLWAGVGRDEPAPEDIEAILDEVLAEHHRAAADLAQLEAAEARAAATAELRRPLVLVEPRGWVAPGRLAQLLSSVPPEGEVLLVERNPDAKRG